MEYDASSPNANGTILVSESLLKAKFSQDFKLAYPFSISDDNKFVLLATDRTPVWRHSFRANYLIYDIDAQTGTWLGEGRKSPPTITNAVWRPNSHVVTYVSEGNIFFHSEFNQTIDQITKDGNAENFFNGIQSWVYEEEIFSDYNALWWSPDGSYLAYMKSNESAVPIFSIPMYEGEKMEFLNIPYPKAGDVNPSVSVWVYDTSKNKNILVPRGNDEYVTAVTWGSSKKLFVRTLDREQQSESLFSYDTLTSASINFLLQTQPNGWVETNPIRFVSETDFLYIKNNGNYYHISYGSLTNDGKVNDKFLTSGTWDVLSIVGWNSRLNTVYYLSSEVDATESHLYSVDTSGTKMNLTAINTAGYYSAYFNPNGTFYVLTYKGPNVPEYSLWNSASQFPSLVKTLVDNQELKNLLMSFDIPQKDYLAVKGVDYDLNSYVMIAKSKNEITPMLFNVYGGPGSQTVTKVWSLGFNEYLASSIGISIASVDGVGTGARGIAFRQKTYKKLGIHETADQIAAAAWIRDNYGGLDPNRFAIWGWSYGGFMTLSTLLQNNSGFRCGMSVAPVSDWHYYDSAYTERYMSTPANNPGGYTNTSLVHQIKEHGLHSKLLLVHGTGDDNVHFQNTAELNKALVEKGIQYDTMFYTNQNHAISGDGSKEHLYRLLSNWVVQCLTT
eukprot:TRINITY_DN7180_c0_g1_i1.p1 TRINITY_DN7180_c0_g1~~TRINITY_DN7180_c0_g1_i1.p1  ORF type:complete len:784 (-),score=128.88 TRINITY_DN7180_c0_g1_i1:19-2034(-)